MMMTPTAATATATAAMPSQHHRSNKQRRSVIIMVGFVVLSLIVWTIRWTVSSLVTASAAAPLAFRHVVVDTAAAPGSRSSSSSYFSNQFHEPLPLEQEQKQQQQQQDDNNNSEEDDDNNNWFEPRLIVCGINGSVQMVEARTGRNMGAGFSTELPLLTTAVTESGDWHVIPSWDGLLYFLPTSTTPSTTVPADSATTSTPTATTHLAPLSIRHLVQHPVRTCTSTTTTTTTTNSETSSQQQQQQHQQSQQRQQQEQIDCGILTATKVTSLWAMDARTGELRWHRSGGNVTATDEATASHPTNNKSNFWASGGANNGTSSSGNSFSSSSSSLLLLLQREDYLIQQVSVATGQVQWNVSVAHFQALDFPTATTGSSSSQKDEWFSNHKEHQLFLPGRSHESNDRISSPPPPPLSRPSSSSSSSSSSSLVPPQLPLIAFGGEHSESLFLFDENEDDHRILWKRTFEQTIASVFGIDAHQQWATLEVMPLHDDGGGDGSENDMNGLFHFENENLDGWRRVGKDSSILPSRFLPTAAQHDGVEDDGPFQPYYGAYFSEHQQRQLSRRRRRRRNADVPLLDTGDKPHGFEHNPSSSLIKQQNQQPGKRQQANMDIPRFLYDMENKARMPQKVQAKKNHGTTLLSAAAAAAAAAASLRERLPSPSSHLNGGDQQQLLRNSEALATIPTFHDQYLGVDDGDDDDDFHSHYNFLQEFYNQQQFKNRRMTANNVLLPRSQQPPPLLLLPSPPPSPFLVMSWATACTLLLLWLVLWVVGGRWWYLRKKQEWLEEQQLQPPAVSASASSTGTTADSDNSSNSNDRADRNCDNNSNSITPTAGLVTLKAVPSETTTSTTAGAPTTTTNGHPSPDKKLSTASFTAADNLPDVETVGSGRGDTATNDGTILVDGIIPLLRYSRYKSEFRQIEPLGRGGFGSVVRCQNVLDGREYAIKKIIIDGDVENDKKDQLFSQRLHRVLREVKSLALLDHVNIVRYYTAWLEHSTTTNGDDDELQKVQDSYYYGNGTTSLEKNIPKKNAFGSTNARSSWLESSSITAAQRRPSGSNWSSVVKSAVLGRSDHRKNWQHHDESFSASLRHSTNHAGLSSWEEYGFTFQDSECGGDENANKNESNSNNNNKSLLPTAADLPAVGDTGDGSNEDSRSITNPVSDGGALHRRHHHQRHSPRDSTKSHQSPVKQKIEVPQRTPPVRHTLYIQMQLCSQKTLGDFLSNAEARRGPSRSIAPGSIDIPYALSLFHQIAQGVQHVHRQGLIHRDLKPNNCFIDEGGVVKVGDFGLSREASSSSGSDLNESSENHLQHVVAGGVEPGEDFNTAGVGTRSYASPEQMNGSDYDSSTDVYSLGIILFELCYPMYTGMERHIVFNKLRALDFPDQWCKQVATSFPALHALIKIMLSPRPKERPTADAVVQEIQSLLGEITILSLDHSKREDGSILLRVEAAPTEGVLRRTMQRIQEAAPDVEIVEYGLRGGNHIAIMEFALVFPEVLTFTTSGNGDRASFVDHIVSQVESSEDVRLVRQVSSGFRIATGREC